MANGDELRGEPRSSNDPLPGVLVDVASVCRDLERRQVSDDVGGEAGSMADAAANLDKSAAAS